MSLEWQNVSNQCAVFTGDAHAEGYELVVSAQNILQKIYMVGRLGYRPSLTFENEREIRINIPEWMYPPAVLNFPTIDIKPVLQADLFVGTSSTTQQRYPCHGLLVEGNDGMFMRFWASGYSGGPALPVSFVRPQRWEEGCNLRFQGWWEAQ